MKRTCLLAVTLIATLVLIQTAEAYPRGGGGRSFSGGGHFSAPHYSGGHYSAARYSGGGYRSSMPNRSYSSAQARYYGPRVSQAAAGVRNPTYSGNYRRFNGNRTTAFNTNTRSYNGSGARLTPGTRTNGARSHGFNGGRVIAQHNANNWNRSWSHNHDHWWHGHRCHYHNGYWFIYDPWPWYPYWGYGYYPYSAYYDGAYYDNGYAADETAPAAYNDQQHVYNENSRVADVQRALADQGYYNGAIDGVIGPATRNAVRRFQRAHGIDATGQIDHGVIEALQLR